MDDPMENTTYTARPKQFAALVDHPLLKELDPEKIITFLHRYDEYGIETTARAKTFTDPGSLAKDAIPTVSLKFCVDTD